MDFKNEKIIGIGNTATIYLVDGYAYKVFPFQYDTDLIAEERNIQLEILANTVLPLVKVYEYENPRAIKMDYMDGAISLNELDVSDKVERLVKMQIMINRYSGLNLSSAKEHFLEHLKDSHESIRNEAVLALMRIPETNNLLHLDFHFTNIFRVKEKWYIIDWLDARLGNPVLEYANTYALLLLNGQFDEAKEYIKILRTNKLFSEQEMCDAFCVIKAYKYQALNEKKALDKMELVV